MKSFYFVAGLFVMLAQGSWQRSLQDTEEKARSLTASQMEPLDDMNQKNQMKRHSQGTFTSDYSKLLDTIRAQQFVQWLMNSKRANTPINKRHDKFARHFDGVYTDYFSRYLEEKATNEFIDWLLKGQERRTSREVAAASEELWRRHADGTFSHELSGVLDQLATKDFLNWLLQSKDEERK
ncbi:pro-glucagon [Tachyglossus aculeatus]|uniref:Preproglucagon n=1 Tax=Tachyglossus aculeatus TaxID=9261 RepID=A0A1L3MY66_TACAU|nr:pro-glucagon [Tachyglossus aculeatus]APH07263.1 preproglucagon [Tachyglossus aculeatus]